MKVVLDCNVFIGAAIKKNVCWKAFYEVIGWHESFLSDEIINEYEKTMRKLKFKKHAHKMVEYLEILKKFSVRVTPVKTDIQLRDPKDEKYLAAAFAAKADVIITGDKDFALSQYGDVKILDPGQFMELVGKPATER